MRMIVGALLILTGEQAFAHSLLIGFPNQVFAREVLYPASMVLAGLGLIFLIWGVISDPKDWKAKQVSPQVPQAESK